MVIKGIKDATPKFIQILALLIYYIIDIDGERSGRESDSSLASVGVGFKREGSVDL